MQRGGLQCKCQAWGVSRAPGVGGRFFLRSSSYSQRCGLVVWALWSEVPLAGDKSPSSPCQEGKPCIPIPFQHPPSLSF